MNRGVESGAAGRLPLPGLIADAWVKLANRQCPASAARIRVIILRPVVVAGRG